MAKSVQTNLLSFQQSSVLTHQEAKFKSIQQNQKVLPRDTPSVPSWKLPRARFSAHAERVLQS